MHCGASVVLTERASRVGVLSICKSLTTKKGSGHPFCANIDPDSASDSHGLLRNLRRDERLNRKIPDPSIKIVLGSGTAAVAAVILAKIVSRPPVALLALAAAPT